MIEYKLSLASSGAVKAPGYEDMLRFGYNKNRGVYRLRVTAADEWKGMKLRVFWHTPEGDPPASLVENSVVEVPAFVTAVSGEGRITFEGSDGTRTITSADMRYRVAANSGTEDGTMPPLGTPALPPHSLSVRRQRSGGRHGHAPHAFHGAFLPRSARSMALRTSVHAG